MAFRRCCRRTRSSWRTTIPYWRAVEAPSNSGRRAVRVELEELALHAVEIVEACELAQIARTFSEQAEFQGGIQQENTRLAGQNTLANTELSSQKRREEFLQQHPEAATTGGLGATGLYSRIQGAQKPEDVPLPSEITGRLGLEGVRDERFAGPFPTVMGQERVALPVGGGERTPIEEVMRAAEARRGGLNTARTEARQFAENEKDRILPTGNKGFIGMSGEPIATERTTSQEAGRQGSVQEAETAGGIHGQFKNLDELQAIEAAKKRGETAGDAGGNSNAGAATDEWVGEMIKLSQQLNQSDDGLEARTQGGIQATQGWFGYAPEAKRLQDLREGATSTLLRRLGRVGTPTENDERRTRRLLPDLGLTRRESNDRNAGVMKLMKGADILQRVLGNITTKDPAAAEAEVAARLAILEKYAQTGVMDLTALVQKQGAGR